MVNAPKVTFYADLENDFRLQLRHCSLNTLDEPYFTIINKLHTQKNITGPLKDMLKHFGAPGIMNFGHKMWRTLLDRYGQSRYLKAYHTSIINRIP